MRQGCERDAGVRREARNHEGCFTVGRAVIHTRQHTHPALYRVERDNKAAALERCAGEAQRLDV
ncbi:hypothetical protein EYF80_044122 [Liparis tanakae]|uniref:Uncharacterized protein n=1 Tax=Liparis tanakae TaxID=230148 RepID=A0A4Z2FY79_9TELE|nr:hypothetical protein EYF80_044122 [Liparis tanakae]